MLLQNLGHKIKRISKSIIINKQRVTNNRIIYSTTAMPSSSKILNKAIVTVAENNKYNNKINIPKYDTNNIEGNIVHVGVGNFFRAHTAFYVHKVLEYQATHGSSNDNNSEKENNKKQKTTTSSSSSSSSSNNNIQWGIVGGAVTDHTYSKKVKTLQEQDMLYTLVQENKNEMKQQIIGSIINCLPYQDDMEPLRNKLMDPKTKIVSLTVTEGGYYLDDATSTLDTSNNDIIWDIEHPKQPKTIFGLIVQTLLQRREQHIKPYTIMSCDNVPKNGDITKSVVVALAKEMDKKNNNNNNNNSSAEWIEKYAKFPNSMVDCITPAIDDEKINCIEKKYGYQDHLPVFCEPFHQWVLEDNFVDNDRPPFDKVGVQMVQDVTPWEDMKLRILNGGHASLSYPAALLGLQYVHEAAGHEIIGQFLDYLERDEVIPIVPTVPDQDLNEYWETTMSRYKNHTLKDSIDRNCEDGSDRQPKFIIQAIMDHIDRGDDAQSVAGLALVSAMWCRFCQGTREDGTKIETSDPMWDELVDRAAKARDTPRVWLEMEDIYGQLAENESFVKIFSDQLKLVNEKGVEHAMKSYIESKQN